jgi:hypothetical protein
MNYLHKYLKYKNKYIQTKYNIELFNGISMYYGLYDINYKIHNDYKNKLNNSSFETTINYLNDIELANKCFNDCISLLKSNNKYCKKTTNNCIPYCEKMDNKCEKTTLNINFNITNDFTDKKINSKYNGLTYYIEKIIPISITDTKYFITIITNNFYKIIMFPSGYRYSKNEFEQYINFNELYNQIFSNDNLTTKYVLCGHSMGAVLLQILTTCSDMIFNENLISRCTIIGSGSYLWCSNINIIIKFTKIFFNRYIFFGNGLFIKDAKQNIFDEFLISKGKDNLDDSIRYYSFPLYIITNLATIINNKIETYEQKYFIDLQIIISCKKKYKIYGNNNILMLLNLQNNSLLYDIKPKNYSVISDSLNYDLVDLHSWNIYSKSILFLLNL